MTYRKYVYRRRAPWDLLLKSSAVRISPCYCSFNGPHRCCGWHASDRWLHSSRRKTRMVATALFTLGGEFSYLPPPFERSSRAFWIVCSLASASHAEDWEDKHSSSSPVLFRRGVCVDGVNPSGEKSSFYQCLVLPPRTFLFVCFICLVLDWSFLEHNPLRTRYDFYILKPI